MEKRKITLPFKCYYGCSTSWEEDIVVTDTKRNYTVKCPTCGLEKHGTIGLNMEEFSKTSEYIAKKK